MRLAALADGVIRDAGFPNVAALRPYQWAGVEPNLHIAWNASADIHGHTLDASSGVLRPALCH